MIRRAAITFSKSIRKRGVGRFRTNWTYFAFALPIKEANKGLALASSFLVFAASAEPSLGVLAAFFIRFATAKPWFLNKSVFFIPMGTKLSLYCGAAQYFYVLLKLILLATGQQSR